MCQACPAMASRKKREDCERCASPLAHSLSSSPSCAPPASTFGGRCSESACEACEPVISTSTARVGANASGARSGESAAAADNGTASTAHSDASVRALDAHGPALLIGACLLDDEFQGLPRRAAEVVRHLDEQLVAAARQPRPVRLEAGRGNLHP